jgi:pimeloyl-ACP methyl ester carboxylesterase
LTHKRLRPPVIVGHSLGAFAALALAALSPSMFRRVILVDGTLLRAASLLRSPRKALLAPSLAVAVAAQFIGGVIPVRHVPTRSVLQWRLARVIALWPYVAHPASLDPAVLACALRNNRGGIGVLQVLAQSHSFDLIASMKEVKQPVDLIWGGEDRLISTEDIRWARTLLNANRSQEIPACGHWPMLERPSSLARFISEWDLFDNEK